MIFGTLASVSFSYILQQQVDPDGRCPGRERTRCWAMVSLYMANVLLGVIYTPALILGIVRWAGRFERTGRCCFKQYESSRPTFVAGETVRRLSAFATTTATVAWSISVSTTLSQLIGELEYVATSGHAQGSDSGPGIGPRYNDPSQGYRTRDNDYGHDHHHAPPPPTPPPLQLWRKLSSSDDDTQDVSLHQILLIAGSKLGACAVALVLFTTVMVLANRYIERARRPLCVEICMLLRGSLHYASAYAISIVMKSVWFFAIDLASTKTGDELKNIRLAWAIVKTLVFTYVARALARKLGWPPEDEAEAVAAFPQNSWRCLAALTHKTLAVFACLAVFDTVSFVITSYLSLSEVQQTAAYLTIAVVALVVATARRASLDSSDFKPSSRSCKTRVVELCCRRRRANVGLELRVETYDDGEEVSNDLDSITRSDAAFVDTTESWIVCFLFWIPYEDLLVHAYDLSSPLSERARTSIGEHVIRLLWQLFLGALTVGICALITSFLVNLRKCLRPNSWCYNENYSDSAYAESPSNLVDNHDAFREAQEPLINSSLSTPRTDDGEEQQTDAIHRHCGPPTLQVVEIEDNSLVTL